MISTTTLEFLEFGRKEDFLDLIQDEAEKTVQDIVARDGNVDVLRGKLLQLKTLLMRLSKNRLTVNNLGEVIETDG